MGAGRVVGMGVIWVGRISRSWVSLTTRVLVVWLYWPVAKMRLPISLSKLIVGGTSKLMASELAVSR